MALQPSASSSAAAASRRFASSSLVLPQHRLSTTGSPISLKSIAQINTPDGSALFMQPYDKSCLKSIEKAILNSDIGLTPNNDGEVIRLSIPQLIAERGKELLTA